MRCNGVLQVESSSLLVCGGVKREAEEWEKVVCLLLGTLMGPNRLISDQELISVKSRSHRGHAALTNNVTGRENISRELSISLKPKRF